jgi:hypothetical protein
MKEKDLFAVAMESHLRIDALEKRASDLIEHSTKQTGEMRADVAGIKAEVAEIKAAVLAQAELVNKVLEAVHSLVLTLNTPKTRVVTAQLPSGPVTLTSSERRQ